MPPSLRNIKQEIASDLGRPSIISGGNLLPWVQQGVLLLNTTLTVRSGQAASHQGLGWETFTDEVIMAVNRQREHVVFLLWGTPARRKGFDDRPHSSSHPRGTPSVSTLCQPRLLRLSALLRLQYLPTAARPYTYRMVSRLTIDSLYPSINREGGNSQEIVLSL